MPGQQDDDPRAALQSGIFTDPPVILLTRPRLAYRGEKSTPQHYLNENKPLFATDAQEKSWLYLLSKYSVNPVQALANYTVQFADNRQYVVGATLPVLLKEGQYDVAQKLLATLPANEMLEERYAVSVATHNKAEALRLARLLYQQEPANLTRLDQLTWQLMQNEQSREAADLLLQRYPFQGDARQPDFNGDWRLCWKVILTWQRRRRWRFYRNPYRWRSNVSGKVSCRVLQIIARQ